MLSNWLTPVAQKYSSSFFNETYVSKDRFPDLTAAKVVVFSRDTTIGNEVRNSLNKFEKHYDISCEDIGNLLTTSPSSIYQIISEIQDGNIIPILIGLNNEETSVISRAMVLEGKLFKHAFLSSFCKVPDEDFVIENLGYQRHVVDKSLFHDIQNSENQGLSLGKLRTKEYLLEPILRDTNYVHLDLSVVRKSDCLCSNNFSTGLSAEELCQLARYAGEGNQLNLISINTSNILKDNVEYSADLIAQFMWYFVEGLSLDQKEDPLQSSNFREYLIDLPNISKPIIFKQSKSSGKWWVKSLSANNKYHSCALQEYEESVKNELPERLLKIL